MKKLILIAAVAVFALSANAKTWRINYDENAKGTTMLIENINATSVLSGGEKSSYFEIKNITVHYPLSDEAFGAEQTLSTVTDGSEYTFVMPASDVYVSAAFAEVPKTYAVTFVDEDGVTVLGSAEYEYGAMPVAPADPSKADDAQYSYTFAGWSPAVESVTGNATYTATYTATHLTIPTELNLTAAGYNTTNNVVLCINFTGDAMVCNDIVLVGNYNDWNTTIANMLKFQPLEGFDGWYVVEFPYVVTYDDYGYEIYPQGKPVELDNEGVFSWDKQSGAPDAWVHKGGNEATIESGFGGEGNISYFYAGAYVYEMTYWKNHVDPCALIKRHDYTVNLYAPDACDGMKPAVIGAFNGWAYGEPMSERTDANGRTFYTLTFNDKEGHDFKIREVEDYDWSNQLQYKTEDGHWSNFNNIPLGSEDTIVLDWSDNTKYRYTYCGLPEIYTVTFVDEDGVTVLSSDEYEYGAMPVAPAAPSKADDAQYTYTFAYWLPAVAIVTDNATYTATYIATPLTVPTELSQTGAAATAPRKVIEDGMVFTIKPDGSKYNVTGQKVE